MRAHIPVRRHEDGWHDGRRLQMPSPRALHREPTWLAVPFFYGAVITDAIAFPYHLHQVTGMPS